MSNVEFPQVSPNMSTTDLANLVARLIKQVDFVVNGNISTQNVRELDAGKVKTGTLIASLVTIRSDLSGGSGAYIQLDSNGMIINDGTIDTLKADLSGKLTITSALIQSTNSSYPYIEMNSANNAFSVHQSSSASVNFSPNYLSSYPAANFHTGSYDAYIGYLSASNTFQITSSTSDISLSTLYDIYLTPTGAGVVHFPDYSKIYNDNTLSDLQTDLNAKVNSGSSTSSNGLHSHGIASGTVLSTPTGTVTFISDGTHTHTV